MELTQAPMVVTAMRNVAASGLATTRAFLQKTNTAKMLSADAATRDAPLPPYIRIIILLGVVIGGLVLSVAVIMFCSHFLKKVKQLKRKSSKRAEEKEDEPERGQYRNLVKQSEETSEPQPSSSSAFVHPNQTNPVTVVNRPDDEATDQQTLLRSSEEEHPCTSVVDNDIDYAFAIYKGEVPASEPDDQPTTTTGSHLLHAPKSDNELDQNDVTQMKHNEEETDERWEERGDGSSPKQFGFFPIEPLINHRRHVSFELENNSNSIIPIESQRQKQENNNNSSGENGLTLQPRGIAAFKQMSFDAGRHSQQSVVPFTGGSTAPRRTDRPVYLSPTLPSSRPRLRERCMTMDPKLQVRDKSFAVRADVHRNQAPIGVHQVPSGVYRAPSGVNQAPSGVNQAPIGIHQAPTGIHQVQTGAHHAPTGVHHTPSGIHQAPTGIYQAPTGVHHAQSGTHHAPTGVYATGSTGTGKGGGVSRNLWLSVALENRRLLEEPKPYWNSLELGQERKMDGNLTRLVNSYDEQIIIPSRLITYDPLRITEFLNGPCGDEEHGGFRPPELRSQYLPKKVKVFDATGGSFDQPDLEERRISRTDDMELAQATTAAGDVRRDSVCSSSRRDSLTAAPYRRDSLTSPLVRQPTWNKRPFRGIAMSRTIDIPDRMTTARRESQPTTHNRLQKQAGPSSLDARSSTNATTTTSTAPSTTDPPKDDQQTSARRQKYCSAFSNRSRTRSVDAAAGSFESNATDDVDASESSHCEVTTTSIESSTTTASSTDSTGDSGGARSSSHKLHQMRDDSGYKSLETQQSLQAKTGTQSLDVQATMGPCRRAVSGQSLDSQGYIPRIVVGGRSPEQGKSSMRFVTAGPRRYEQYPMHSVTEENAKERVFQPRVEDAVHTAVESRPIESANKAGASGSLESSPQLQSKNFLEVPNAERGFRLPLTKARSQDFVESMRQDESSPGGSSVPSSASSIFPLSLEKLWHRAEHYLTSAVTQAESLLGRGGSREEGDDSSVSPNPDDAEAVPGTEEEGATGLDKSKSGDESSFPSTRQTTEVEGERGQDPGTVSSTLPTTSPLACRVSDTVIRPVWSQLIAEKEALALEEKQARENVGGAGGGGVALNTKIGAIQRGDLKTASKKRREYRSRKQLTEVSPDSTSSLEPSSSDRLFDRHPYPTAAQKDGGEAPPTTTTADFRRSLTTRDYTVDEKTYAIFNEFIQHDPKFDSTSGSCQTSAAASTTEPTSSSEIQFHQVHPVTVRPTFKQMDPGLDSKRAFQGPYPTAARSVSLDVEMTVPLGARSPKFDYASIAEETLPLDGES